MRNSNLDILLLCSNHPLTRFLFLSGIFPDKTVLHEKICLTPVCYLQRDSQGYPRAAELDFFNVHALYPSSSSTEISIYLVYLEGEKKFFSHEMEKKPLPWLATFKKTAS